MEVPRSTAAMVPEAVDNDGRGVVVVVVVFLCVDAASADPPIAATEVTRATPSPRAANLERDAHRTVVARGVFESAPIQINKFSSSVLDELFARRTIAARARQFRVIHGP
jgi:hypothetical protein